MKPKFRPIEAHPIQHEGDDYFLLQDPQSVAPDLMIPHAYGALLSLFDGTRTVSQIASDFQQAHHFEIEEAFIEQMIQEMDAHFLLDSPHFASQLEARKREYSQAVSRPAELAGRAYLSEPEELSDFLDELSQRAELRDSQANASTRAKKKLRGIVVPHIDFGRGGEVEALAYNALRGETFDTLVVFGIAHKGVRYPFCATEKDYETPLGTCVTDREFVRELQNRVGEKLTREEMAHQNEHSIEFVTVFLQHHKNLKNARIVPILCGGFFEELRSGNSPANNSDVAQFCAALHEIVEERESCGEKIGFVVSVDLAHVGTQFGDERVLTQSALAQIEISDRKFLRCAEIGDAEALHAALSRDNNARNVDAHPALYTLLHAFPNLRAELLEYDQAFNAEQNIVVSFAAMTLFEQAES